MRYNWKFAKSEDGLSLEYAPAEFDIDGIHYNSTTWDEYYNAIGYYFIVRNDMPEKEGYYYTPKYTRSQKQNQRYSQEGVWETYTQEILLEEWEEHKVLEPEPVEETVTEAELQTTIQEGVNSIDS